MPIRFRCAYCNQLMGISTRKAGTVVKCPKCAGEIIVPSLEAPPPPEEPAPQEVEPSPQQPVTAAGGAFEAKEFEEYFNEAANGSVSASAPARTETSAPEPMPAPADVLVTPPSLPPTRRGIFLSVTALLLSVIVVFLLLVLVFVLGVVIGRQSAPPRESASNSDYSRISISDAS